MIRSAMSIGALVAVGVVLRLGGQVPASGESGSLWPAPRAGHVMAGGGAVGGVYLFGGQIDSAPRGVDTLWRWSGDRWEALSAAGPSNRTLPAAAFDTRRGVLVVFGGLGMDAASTRHGDTWEWDGRVWRQRTVAGPGPRDHHAMAYDEARGQVVMFGGQDAARHWRRETWVWNGVAWTIADSSTGPAAGRVHHAMAYDGRRGRVVMYGGTDSLRGGRDETWEWDGAAWRRIPAAGPGPRRAARMAYDAARGVTILFGGGETNDTWTWDGATWRRASTAGPPGRLVHAMAYDARRARVVLFGGSGAGGPGLYGSIADVWEWDGVRWSARRP